ncbi:PREDICTED: cuticle protein 18.7-like [Cyphomyrmex costatus]|uniref:cuticle protein 18.7-like n=1 Tax=Cyphomyrmex costatus TaxID=456900 RepID=UPI0008524089|nr:PREDICTED: cuticle protein 18.7-like [Cyphomyrmex costatus]
MTLAAGCGPLLRVDDSLPGFTYIKGDTNLDTVRHSSPYFRANTGNHPAALHHVENMKAFIVLFALCAIATATPAPVQDTPEVAQAKAAHLATHAYEAARNSIGYGWPGYGWSGYGWPALYAPAIAYGAPIGADGRVIDTPEVAQAKAAHLAAHAQEAAKIGLTPYGALAYATAPFYAYSYAPLGLDGRVIDTPEVAQAKAAHLAAHAAAARNV